MTAIPYGRERLAAGEPNGRRPLVMHQRWESLLFLHWPISPERIQATLPAGLTVDTFEGAAFIGIVPFFMRNVRPIGTRLIHWLANFQELNVRTYVYDSRGIPGVWFYSLDCNQPVAVQAARTLTGLPYFHATMTATKADFIDYSSRRRATEQVARYRYRGAGEDTEPHSDSLESFLLDRYYLYAIRRSSLVRAQVSHERYRYRATDLAEWSAIPAHIDGFPEVSGRPSHRCYVDGFDVKIYATEKLGMIY